MKKSKKEQAITREKLIETAVDIMIQKGYEKATMREIARESSVGDATIYNYFPTKEKIVWGYIQLRHQQAIQKLSVIPGLGDYTLQEKLQSYFETILEGFLPDREFLPIAFKMTHQSFLTHSTELKAINSLFIGQVREFLTEAIESKEIPDQPVESVIPYLIMDLYFMIVLYWLKDNSEHFHKTTELMDLIFKVVIGVLQQGLISKVLDVGSFLFRHHLFAQIQPFLEGKPFKEFGEEFKGFVS